MSRPELEEARLLLRKSREDAAALDKLAADADIADAIVGFHAQQAAEKALKAVLAAYAELARARHRCGDADVVGQEAERRPEE